MNSSYYSDSKITNVYFYIGVLNEFYDDTYYLHFTATMYKLKLINFSNQMNQFINFTFNINYSKKNKGMKMKITIKFVY